MDSFHPVTTSSTKVDILSSWDTFIYVFSLIDTALLIFLLVYYVITLSDLDCDHVNSQQCCYRLNWFVVPKLSAHLLLSFLFLASGHYYLCLASLPLAIHLIYQYRNVPVGNFGVYDPTEIHRMGQLKAHLRTALINMAYYLLIFFVYIYCFLKHMLRLNPREKYDFSGDHGF